MNIEFKKITDHFFSFAVRHQKNILVLAVSLIALSIFYLYRNIFFETKKSLPLLGSSRIVELTNKNLQAVKEEGYLTRILFRGSLDKQESIAEKMASDLGIAFHKFDGRELNENSQKFTDLLRRVSSGSTPELIFVSHADEICKEGNSVLHIILVHTGSVSRKLLLCLGVSSERSLPLNLASRYRAQVLVE